MASGAENEYNLVNTRALQLPEDVGEHGLARQRHQQLWALRRIENTRTRRTRDDGHTDAAAASSSPSAAAAAATAAAAAAVATPRAHRAATATASRTRATQPRCPTAQPRCPTARALVPLQRPQQAGVAAVPLEAPPLARELPQLNGRLIRLVDL